MVNTHTMEFYSATRRNKSLTQSATQMNVKCTVLSEKKKKAKFKRLYTV